MVFFEIWVSIKLILKLRKLQMDKKTLINKYTNNPSEFMDFPFDLAEINPENKTVFRTITTTIGGILILFSTFIISTIGINFLSKLFILFTLASFCYGFYLFISNKAVLYASKTDVFNQIAIYGVPLLIFGILNFLIDPPSSGFMHWVVAILGWGSAAASLVYFGLRSGYSHTQINSPLSDYQLMCVNMVKFCLPILFLLSMNAAYQKMRDGFNQRDGYKVGAGMIGFYVISRIFSWLLPNAFNFHAVMEKR